MVLSVFPRHLRASLSSAFIAGGAFGSVLGMAAGGTLSAHFGWRWAFAGMALFGLVLVVIYRAIITEPRLLNERRKLGEDLVTDARHEAWPCARCCQPCSRRLP